MYMYIIDIYTYIYIYIYTQIYTHIHILNICLYALTSDHQEQQAIFPRFNRHLN